MSLSKSQLFFLKRLLRRNAPTHTVKMLKRFHDDDLAELFTQLSQDEQISLIRALMTGGRAGSLLAELPDKFLKTILPELRDQEIIKIISELSQSDLDRLFSLLDEERQNQITEKMPPNQLERWHELLEYPEGSVGRIMVKELFSMDAGTTAKEAITTLRSLGPEYKHLYYLYIINENRFLLGVVPLSRLLFSSNDQKLEDIMITDLVKVSPYHQGEKVAELISQYDLSALPVTSDDNRLLGLVVLEDILDILEEEATEDIYNLAGLSTDDRIFSSTKESFRKRVFWILLNLFTAFAAASVVGFFEETISRIVALAIFMPVVAGMGGNIGSQSMTVTTRGIALGELKFTSSFRALMKEVSVGLLMGGMFGLLTGVLALIWKENIMIGLVLFLAMIINMGMAGLVGAIIPLALQKIDKDPAVGGHIILTAVSDSMGFLIFLGLASWLL